MSSRLTISTMSIDYKYFNELSEGVLMLLEQGKLTELKTLWWQEKNGGGACSVRNMTIPLKDKQK